MVTIMKKNPQNLKTRVGIFKSMGGSIPGGNFLGGNFPGTSFPVGSLMGGNFPGGNFLDGSSPDTENRWELFRINLCYFVLVSRMNTSLKLCACIVCSLLFTYAWLEAVIEKCLFKLSQVLEKYLWKYLLLLKLQDVGLWLY